jgi:dephospho-CoA kinase
MTVIAVVTPKHLRYQRMANRTERPMQAHEVDERDWAEIENIEKGGPIAIADYFVHNDGSVEHMQEQVGAIVKPMI